MAAARDGGDAVRLKKQNFDVQFRNAFHRHHHRCRTVDDNSSDGGDNGHCWLLSIQI